MVRNRFLVLFLTVLSFSFVKGAVITPLNQLSQQEKEMFPTASVVACSETNDQTINQKIRTRILKTSFKYPYVRMQEVINTTTGKTAAEETGMVADHLLVTLAPGETPAAFLQKLHLSGASLERLPIEHSVYRLKLAAAMLEAVPEAIRQINSKHLAVINCEPDYILSVCNKDDQNAPNDSPKKDKRLIPNDPFYQMQTYLWESWNFLPNNNTYTSDSGINAEAAWNIRNSAPSIVVAVVDSGIRYTHEDLADNMWTNPNPDPAFNDIHGFNAIAMNGNPMDDDGHGTHCAGIIGAVGNNGVGISGIAWKVQLMACKCLNQNGAGFLSDEIIAMEYARCHGAKIVNCSFGRLLPSKIELAEIKKLCDAGIIVVASAGNDCLNNDDVDFFSNYPSSYKLDNIVSVASISFLNTLSFFSNYGALSVHLAAPGENIYSTSGASDSSYEAETGTSVAAPLVTGALALMMEQFPELSYQQLINHLLCTTDKVADLSGKVISEGRLNLYRALKENPLDDPAPILPPPSEPIKFKPLPPPPAPSSSPEEVTAVKALVIIPIVVMFVAIGFMFFLL